MKTVIEMAREARVYSGCTEWTITKSDTFVTTHKAIERLVELVRADERNSWPAEMETMERQVNILTDALAKARADERKACSQTRAGKPRELKPVGRGTLLDEQQYFFDKGWREGAASVRAAIRARSNT